MATMHRVALAALVAMVILVGTGPAISAPVHTKVRIDTALVTSVEKFVSKSGKTHVRFEFTVDGKPYHGIMFDGDWNSDALEALRSGRVSLTGYWDKYQNQPSFVTSSVQRR